VDRIAYMFKTDYIQAYYEKQIWYKPNKAYKADREGLSTAEKEWLHTLHQNHD